MSRSNSKQKLLASVDIFESVAVLSQFDEVGVTRKHVTHEQLADAFCKLRSQKMTPLSPEVKAYGFDGDGKASVLIAWKGRDVKVRIEVNSRGRNYKIKMPNLLAKIKRNDDGWCSVAKVWAFSRSAKLQANTRLYLPPLPNMYESAGVCMGNVKVNQFKDLSPLQFFEGAFIRSTFTDHFAHHPLRPDSGWRNILHALKSTKGNVPLNKLKEVCTYGEIFD